MGLGAAGTAAAISATGSAIGAAGSIVGSSKASSSSGQSAAMQALEYNQNISNTADYIAQGQSALNSLAGNVIYGGLGQQMDLSGMPTSAQAPQFSWNPTQAGLEQTPGYQFTLNQGLLSTQNAAAAQGLGVSGAALKGAAGYATGLANSTYNQQLTNAINTYNAQMSGYTASASQFQNQFNDYWTNQNNRYNQLYNIASMGANSAAGQGTSGVQSASNIGNALTNQGTASSAGITGATNAISTGLNSPQVSNYLSSLFTPSGTTIGSGSGTDQTYTNPATGTTYTSSSDPNQNF
jgi:hypothetical protein